MQKSFETAQEIKGPLLMVDLPDGEKAAYEELVEVKLTNGEIRRGKVLKAEKGRAVVQMFTDTKGLAIDGAKVSFLGKVLELPVSLDMLGRIFDGAGKPIDGGDPIIAEKHLDVNGAPINPASRQYPSNFIQTGITTIDLLNSLVRGQKLPIFSSAGMPHNEIAMQIARQAKVNDGAEFAVVFGTMGVTFEESQKFIDEFRNTGALEHAVMFINTSEDPVIERISTPRLALTAAEYLAYEQDMHVLVILTDITNYAEALREVSAALREVPSRRGYPGYMYSDLATLYERAGCIKGKKGSITQIPILTMPDFDRTHPVPNLTGYITEGQFYLSPEYKNKSYEPPIDPMSLSRLKNEGIGKGKTREDHGALSDQLVSAYSHGIAMRDLAVILGESSLSENDRKFIPFAEEFEKQIVNQGYTTDRSIEDSLNIGWKILNMLPRNELKKVKPEFIKKYMHGIEKNAA